MRTPHMLAKLRRLGTSVSPAPRSAPLATMLAAKSGSAKSSTRRTRAPAAWTAASGVSNAIIWGAKSHSTAPRSAMTSIPVPVQSHASCRASAGRRAPTDCPTSVVAACPMP